VATKSIQMPANSTLAASSTWRVRAWGQVVGTWRPPYRRSVDVQSVVAAVHSRQLAKTKSTAKALTGRSALAVLLRASTACGPQANNAALVELEAAGRVARLRGVGRALEFAARQSARQPSAS
jgi:hypothetical protein